MPWASPVDPYVRDEDGPDADDVDYVPVGVAAELMHCSVARVRWLVRERLIACRWDGGDFLVNPEVVVTV